MLSFILITASMAALPALGSIEYPNVQSTPPMGFNNWARFECALNQTLFTETADAMASNGLRDAGYTWLNLDDCWLEHQRTPDGKLHWDTTKFPNGLPWLSNYLKERGFKFGIYEDSGNATCGGYPGSYGHEQLDAETFASWGVEYLKLDGCNVYPTQGRTEREEYLARYEEWHEILSNMKHPLVFSESAPAYFAHEATLTDWYGVMDKMPIYGELARHSNDIIVYSSNGNSWDSVMTNYDYETRLARYQVPGFYNDPDFLIPDNRGLTADEKRSHFALWASFGAPLLISAYIPELTKEELDFLTNKDLIAVDQDSLAQQATLVSRDGTFDVLTRSLSNGDRLVTVLNRGTSAARADIPVERLGLSKGCTFPAKDLWSGRSSKITDAVSVKIRSHATAVYRISVDRHCSAVTPTGMVFNTASLNCLTQQSSTIGFVNCQGQDSQVWQLTQSGSLSPLSDSSMCLTTDGNGVSVQQCDQSDSQRWRYSVQGNLRNENSGQCLTEGSAGVAACAFEEDSQVFGLPAGVDVNW